MSNIQQIIEERAAQIGEFLVGRLLPFREKRMVGPFIFIDHMGPAKITAKQSFDIGPHPHIGLSTLTFLLEGSVMHRDSIGSVAEIQPGAVNWMTAGRGVVHSERAPESLRNKAYTMHGLQIWVALPKQLEDMEPQFHHIAADEIPSWEEKGLHFKLIAGKALGKSSPVPVHSDLYFIEIKSSKSQRVDIGDGLFGESGLYILEGAVLSEGHRFEPKQMLVAKNSKLCSFEMEANSTVYIFGGEVFPEERFIDWNFVSSDKEKLRKARKDWKEQKFPKIEGENDFIPYPDFKLKQK